MNQKYLILLSIILAAAMSAAGMIVFVGGRVARADLDNDGQKETYRLKNGTLKVQLDQEQIWASDPAWRVTDFALEDVTNDGKSDLSMSVWKAGNFGVAKPFWVEENDMSVKNHFFVFNLLKGKMEAVWQSSNLDEPNCSFAVKDIDGDGKNELLTVEGDYADAPKCIKRKKGVWKWNGWGFSREEEKGLHE